MRSKKGRKKVEKRSQWGRNEVEYIALGHELFLELSFSHDWNVLTVIQYSTCQKYRSPPRRRMTRVPKRHNYGFKFLARSYFKGRTYDILKPFLDPFSTFSWPFLDPMRSWPRGRDLMRSRKDREKVSRKIKQMKNEFPVPLYYLFINSRAPYRK